MALGGNEVVRTIAEHAQVGVGFCAARVGGQRAFKQTARSCIVAPLKSSDAFSEQTIAWQIFWLKTRVGLSLPDSCRAALSRHGGERGDQAKSEQAAR